MSNNIPRPEGALTIEEYNALPKGTPLKVLYGHMANKKWVEGEHPEIKASNCMLFKDHKSWSDCHEGSEEDIVFDTHYTNDKSFRHRCFVNDRNMDVNYSHNHNYLFADIGLYNKAVDLFAELRKTKAFLNSRQRH